MKEQDFIRMLGNIPQDMQDELAEWQQNHTPVTGEESVRADNAAAHLTADYEGGKRQNVRPEKLRFWKAGIAAAMAACLVVAVSVGREAIGQKQLLTGHSGDTSLTEQLSQREPIKIENFCADGCKLDAVPALSENGKAEILHSLEDAQPWIENLRQNSVLFEDSPLVEMLQNEKQYQYYDVIMTAVPFSFVYDSYGVAEYGFTGGTITPDGKLTAEFSFVTVGMDLHYLLQPQIETLCCCFAVPKGSVPEITDFAFQPVIYDCTAPLPDDLVSRDEQTEYYFALPNRQEYVEKFSTPPYLYWVEDETKAADAAHEPVQIMERLKIFGGAEQVMMPVPKEGTVQVLRSMADTETVLRCSDEEVGYKAVNFKEFLNDDIFAQYDVLYYAFKDEQIPLYACDFDLAGGCIAEDGKTLKLDYHALMFDPAHLPPHFCDSTEPYWNTYCFYAVPKDSLPELEILEISFEQYPVGDVPDEILAHADDTVDISDNEYTTKQTKLKQYLETTQEYLDWVMSMPKPKYITWEKADSTPLPSADFVEIKAAEQPENLPDKFYAWYWTSYSGDDIALDGKTVSVIRTAADGKRYLTRSGQQNDTSLATYLSADWLENGGTEFTDPVNHAQIANEGEPHDVIFIGIPTDELPKNTLSMDYHNGTVTPSGKLHLDFSVLTVSDEAKEKLPEDRRPKNGKNYYYFMSVPEGCLPDITDYEVTFTAYHTEKAPQTALTEEYQYNAYRDSMPEYGNMKASVLCGKYISWIPENQPNVLTPVGVSMQNIAVPNETGQAKDDAGFRVIQGGEYDTLELTIPLLGMEFHSAITDMRITSDGVLAVLVNQYRDNRPTDDAPCMNDAAAAWTLKFPAGSLPEIKEICIDRNELYFKYGENDGNDEYAFIRKAGELQTITLLDATYYTKITGGAVFMKPTAVEQPAAFMVRSEADYQAMTAQYPMIDCGFTENDPYSALFLLIPVQSKDAAFCITALNIEIDELYAYVKVGAPENDTNTATAVVRLYVGKNDLPDLAGGVPLALHDGVTALDSREIANMTPIPPFIEQ